MSQSTLSLFLGDARVPALAPLVILAFLGATLGLVCASLGAAVSAAVHRVGLAKWLTIGALAGAAAYAALLFGAALFSRDRTLAPGERKPVDLAARRPWKLVEQGERRRNHEVRHPLRNMST